MRISMGLLVVWTIAVSVLSGCGPIYVARKQLLAKDLEKDPLILDVNVSGHDVKFQFQGKVIEGYFADVEASAMRFKNRWYVPDRVVRLEDRLEMDQSKPLPPQMNRIGREYHFVDKKTDKKVKARLEAIRVSRFEVNEVWYTPGEVRFFESLDFSDDTKWKQQRVRVTTSQRQKLEGEVEPLGVESFAIDGTRVTLAELEEFNYLHRCNECEGGRAFLIWGGVILAAGAGLAAALGL